MSGLGSGASLVVIGMLLREVFPKLASMPIDMDILGSLPLANLFIWLGLIVIGGEIFKIMR